MPEQKIIQEQGQLDLLVSQINQHDWICLDTEFLRTKTYYAKLCLVQIAIPQQLAIIDVMHPDLKLQEFYDSLMERTLVMHACRQDLEVLYQVCQRLPKAVFDTQLAAAFIGYGDQIGYANLVEQMTSVKLKKSHTRTNWEQRPLSSGQLEYAFDDVLYLQQIYPELLDRLKDLQRYSWYQEEMQSLLQKEWICGDIQMAWERVRGIKQLKPKQRTVAQGLASWREQTAQQLDRPRNWILKDEDLIMLSRRQPKTTEELAKYNKSLAGGKFSQQLVEHVRNLAKRPPEMPKEEPVLSEKQKDLVDTLALAIRFIGQEYQLQPNLIATRKQLESVVCRPQEEPFTGWRRAIVNEPIQGLLSGQLVLTIQDGKPRLIPLRNDGLGTLDEGPVNR